MRRLSIFLYMIFFITSCSMFGGSDGYFPEKKYDFLKSDSSPSSTLGYTPSKNFVKFGYVSSL